MAEEQKPKRRKIRPNNAIAVERAKLVAEKKKDKKAKKKEELTNKNEENKNDGSKPSKKRKRSATPHIPPPATTGYASASDSDETDNESSTKSKKTTAVNNTADQKGTVKASSSEDVSRVTAAGASTSAAAPTTRSSEFILNSDEDSSDTEDTSSGKGKSELNVSIRNDIDEATNAEEANNLEKANDAKKAKEKGKLSVATPRWSKAHLEVNRIAFRRTRSYNPSKTPASNLVSRLNDTFIPRKVNEEGFITSDSEESSSDSSSDNEDNKQKSAKTKGKSKSTSPYLSDSDSDSSDSDDDYENKDYPPWQRTLGWNRHPERDGEWPMPRKLGYSDKLRLEKRIKKICKREGMTFDEAREIFSSTGRGRLPFFQKIGKIFPEMPLYRLAKTLKEMYHVKRNDSPWTPEEISKLESLIEIYGVNTKKLCEHLNRSPKNINDFLFRQKNNASSKPATHWTQEEDEKLAKLIATKAEKHPKTGRILFKSIVSDFNGERSQRQIYARYYNIRHRINPDGTLAENRAATPFEELQYLKSLLAQVEKHNLVEESQLDYAKDRGFVNKSFYLTNRASIVGFEKMKIKDILLELIDRQKKRIKRKQSMGELTGGPLESESG